MLVISAGALAAIVLYNLTNINIDERRREIATLRVLGYRKRKWQATSTVKAPFSPLRARFWGWASASAAYVHHQPRKQRFHDVWLGDRGAELSLVFLLTLAFAAIVYAFMLIKLNRINMRNL